MIDYVLSSSRKFCAREWNEYIDRYHYLGYTALAGAQMRYFVYAGDELVALLGFSA